MKKFITLLIVFLMCVSSTYAETIWVLCQTDSYVNIRPFPNKKHEASGYMECGWSAGTNSKSKNGYLYLDEIGNEDGYGWINKGYVVYSEPIIYAFKTNIYSSGRVACWRSIGGNRRCWAQEGDVVTVFAVSREWSVTDKGFIKTQYLGVDYDILLGVMAGTESNTESNELHWEDDP